MTWKKYERTSWNIADFIWNKSLCPASTKLLKTICAVLLSFAIYIAVGHQIARGGGYPINRFIFATSLFLSKASALISNVILCCFLLCTMFWGYCSNVIVPFLCIGGIVKSLFKLSFQNLCSWIWNLINQIKIFNMRHTFCFSF